MPLLFSYGSLQRADVQIRTFGRRLDGPGDELPRYEISLVNIEDAEDAAMLGLTHYANATFTGRDDSRVPGTAYEVTDAELAARGRVRGAGGLRADGRGPRLGSPGLGVRARTRQPRT